MALTYPTHFSHLGGFPSQNISLALHARSTTWTPNLSSHSKWLERCLQVESRVDAFWSCCAYQIFPDEFIKCKWIQVSCHHLWFERKVHTGLMMPMHHTYVYNIVSPDTYSMHRLQSHSHCAHVYFAIVYQTTIRAIYGSSYTTHDFCVIWYFVSLW